MKGRQWWKDWKRNTGCDSRRRGACWGAAEHTGRNKNKNLLGEDNVVKVPALQRKLAPNINGLANGVWRGGSSGGKALAWRKGLWKTEKSNSFCLCDAFSVSLYISDSETETQTSNGGAPLLKSTEKQDGVNTLNPKEPCKPICRVWKHRAH